MRPPPRGTIQTGGQSRTYWIAARLSSAAPTEMGAMRFGTARGELRSLAGDTRHRSLGLGCRLCSIPCSHAHLGMP